MEGLIGAHGLLLLKLCKKPFSGRCSCGPLFIKTYYAIKYWLKFYYFTGLYRLKNVGFSLEDILCWIIYLNIYLQFLHLIYLLTSLLSHNTISRLPDTVTFSSIGNCELICRPKVFTRAQKYNPIYFFFFCPVETIYKSITIYMVKEEKKK